MMLFKRHALLIVAFLMFSTSAFSDKVDAEKARKVATNWYQHYAPASKQQASITKVKGYKWGDRTSFYICSFDQGGFVIVSANDQVTPILGYGFEHGVPDEITNEAVKGWFDGYARQIDTAFVLNLRSDEETAKWKEISENTFPKAQSSFVEPLLTTTWDQGWPYNAMCPEDASGSGGHCYTGCVATAYGQILKYYHYPPQGKGSITYTDASGHPISANFSSTYYNWDEMQSSLSPSDTNYQDIAEFLYHCGAGAHSNYWSGATTGFYVIEPILNFFDYAYSTIKQVNRESFNQVEWDSILVSELNQNRPIYYTGSGSDGHAFVCDGYENNEYFHFNVGWGGQANGYYITDNLVFSGMPFNDNQYAILGIKPNDGSNISEDTTFSGDHHFTTSLYFSAVSKVSINPGTSFAFDSACQLKIGGSIQSEGTALHPVSFTAFDSTGVWGGIYINSVYHMLMTQNEPDTLSFNHTIVSNSETTGIAIQGTGGITANADKLIKGVVIKNSELYNNSGCALSGNFTRLMIDSCQIYNNGGGINLYIGWLDVKNSVVQYNSGVAISYYNQHDYFENGSSNVINNNISYNVDMSSPGDPGGIYIHSGGGTGSCLVSDNIISNNTGNTGGFRIHGNTTLENNSIYGNTAMFYGGGGMVSDGALVRNNKIFNNQAPYGGGGLCVSNGGRIINNLIYNNSSGIAGVALVSATIANNTIANNGNGISFVGFGSMEIKNNILWNSGVEIDVGDNQVSVSRCIVRGGIDNIHETTSVSTIEKIINRNPNFINPSENIGNDTLPTGINWGLQATSPAIDAAIDDTSNLSLPTMDVYGYQRIKRILDIGAIENQSDTIFPCFIEDGYTLNSCAGNPEFITIPFRGENCQIQWYFNDSINLGVTNDTLAFNLLSEANSGKYSCIVSNIFGQDTSDYISVNVFSSAPSNPSAIYGNDTIHHFEKELIYWTHIIPNCPSLNWITSPGLSYFAVNDTTINLMVIDTISTGYIKFFGENPCGTSIDTTVFNLTILSMPEILTISGDSTICAGTSCNWWDNMYTTDFNYQYDLIEWQIPLGISAKIYGEYGYMGIYQVDTLALSDTLYARWNKNNYGTGQWSPFPLSVIPIILNSAETIIGSDSVCQGSSSISYSVPIIPNATSYEWIYSGTGVTINGITNSISIDFDANATSGNLTVRGINDCGNGAASENFSISVCELINQPVDLSSGWNITSFYVHPAQTDLDSIFSPIINSGTLIKAINESGNFIQNMSGIGWINTIGNMENTEGYYIKMNTGDTLVLNGAKVNFPYDIPLQTGWNIMGYPLQDSSDAIRVLQSLIDSNLVIKVIDESGGFIQELPGMGWMNTIGYFKPGEGYYIKLNNDCNLPIESSYWQCGDTIVDPRDSQSYNTVSIGNQCWMAENLNVGTRIDLMDISSNDGLIEKYCFDDNISNCGIYGGIYLWDELMQYETTEGEQGICPEGWHVPTDTETKTMEMELGMTQAQADSAGWRGTDEGGKMKETGATHWYSPNTGATNASGFTAFAGGFRYTSGGSGSMGYQGLFWTSTEDEHDESSVWVRFLTYDNDQAGRGSYAKIMGLSVRCVKD